MDKESLIVLYNDVEQNEVEISYDETIGKIKLSPEPSENSTVQIKFTLK